MIARPEDADPRRKPRLLLVTHYFPAHSGGVEIVAGQLASRLQDKFDLTWMAAACDPAPHLPGARIEAHPAWNGLERFGLPWPVWGWHGWRALARAVQHSDAIHLHDFIYPASIAALVLSKLFHKPVVITQHIGDIEYRSTALRTVLRLVNRSLGRLALGHADQTIFISPRVKKLFESFTHFPKPPEYWPNGVDTHVFAPLAPLERQALRTRLGIPEGERVILFVGRFVEKKGVALLKEMASLRSDWRWWFAGWGKPGPLHPDTWALPQVTLWKARSGHTLAELYQAADVLVLPSYGEGFPLVVQESLACGTPVVISIDTAHGGPAFPRAIHALAHNPHAPDLRNWLTTLEAVIDAPAPDRSKTRDAAARFAATEWNWDRLAERYAHLFKQLSDSARH